MEAHIKQVEAHIKQLEAAQSDFDFPEIRVPKTHQELSAATQAYEAALWTNPSLATKKRAFAEEPATVEEHTAAEGAVANRGF
ncbi:hypothetical protein GMDG_01569 [Pseudogymnoascus destructans 20631-21]|uniref:Uncharacterized protein n=1 Tax=Pseudogymnoascus destructans (strain ATCC MYA-4855 / 20631-21) TaxID=658429 RepID=L8FWY3_PSED2|nr:hypothetical protein GMDG_01569 [Pseudogymnoascus destructans 20631-21]